MPKNPPHLMITEAARAWIGTPFLWYGRIKGVGCDCLGLVIGVAQELGLKTKNGRSLAMIDRTNYHQAHDGTILKTELENNLNQTATLEPGCLALMSYGNTPQHLAIIGDYDDHNLSLIHAHISCRMVVEHIMDDELKGRVTKVFKL